MGRGRGEVDFEEVERIGFGSELEQLDENGITYSQRLLLDRVISELHDAANIIADYDTGRLERLLRQPELWRFLTKEEQTPLTSEFWHWLLEASLLKKVKRSSMVAYTTLDLALGLHALRAPEGPQAREHRDRVFAEALQAARESLRTQSFVALEGGIEQWIVDAYTRWVRRDVATRFLALEPQERFERLFRRPEKQRESDMEAAYRLGDVIEEFCLGDTSNLQWPSEPQLTGLLGGLLEECRNDRWAELISRCAGRIVGFTWPEAGLGFASKEPVPHMDPALVAMESIDAACDEILCSPAVQRLRAARQSSGAIGLAEAAGPS